MTVFPFVRWFVGSLVRLLGVVVGAALVLAAAGCGSSSTQTPTAPSSATPASPATVTWSPTLTTKGAAARQFTTSKAGTVTVTLVSVSPSPGPVGLGVGIPQVGSGGCALEQALDATAATDPLISAAVDPGVFCVKVWDLGNITGSVTVSITLVYP